MILEKQYKALMDNGVTFAQRFNLRPGIALSPHQVTQLTSDIVWLEKESVTLPNGRIEQVLVPKVYAVVQKGDITGNGAFLSGNTITHRGGELLNNGTVAGRTLVQFESEAIRNSGNISAGTLVGNIRGDMDNIGGSIVADRAILLNVAGNFTHQSTTHTMQVNTRGYQRRDTAMGRKGLLHVKGKEGLLHLQANNIALLGAEIINEGKGQTYLSANHNVTLNALSVGFDEKMGKGNHRRHEKAQGVYISHIKGKGDVILKGNNLYAEGAMMESEAKLAAVAENDLLLKGATTQSEMQEYHKTKSGSSVAKSSKTTFDQYQDITQIGTAISGQEILLSAGHNIQATGLQAIADNDLFIQAGNNIDITADTNYQKEVHYTKKTRSGILPSSGGGVGVTIGKQSQSHRTEQEGWTQSDARSVVGSIGGNVTVQAGNHIQVMGADTIAGNTLALQGKTLSIEAGKDYFKQKEEHIVKQSGVSVSFSAPAVDMVQKMNQSLQRSQSVKNDKLSALYKVKAAQELILADRATGAAVNTFDALMGNEAMSKGDISNPSFKLAVSIGSSKSKQTNQVEQILHQASNLSGKQVQLTTTQGDIQLKGVNLTAQDTLDVHSANDLQLQSVADTVSQRSQSKHSGWNVGGFVAASGSNYGGGIEATAHKGKGRENTDTITHQLTALKANTLNLSTQGDTTLKGASIQADTIKADIQGNLTIESEQDTHRHKSKHTQGSVGASAVISGTGSGASFNASHSKAKLNYQQVHTQSGLTVGQGGMTITVGNNTHLKGGIIDSTAPVDKNTFTTQTLTVENILNQSEIKVQSASVGVSTNPLQNAWSAVGTAASVVGGNIHKEDSSTTYSVIGQNISLNVKEGSIPDNIRRDKEGANNKVQLFDKADAQERMEMAQVMGEISQNTITIALQPMLDKAEADRAAAEKALKDKSLSPKEKAYYINQARMAAETLHTYGKGSDLQLGIRAATGVLQGLATGNTNAAIVGGLSPFLNKAIKEATTDKATNKVNLFANTVAHAILGAVEAKMLNTNVAAGAAGAVVGETTAHIIADKLYQKSPEALTEQEKETISALSQVVAGLSGVAVGDNFQSAITSSEIGKRAVENNFLNQKELKERNQLVDTASRRGTLTEREAEKLLRLNDKDNISDMLLARYQENPNSLTPQEKEQLAIYLDVASQGNVEEVQRLLSTPVKWGKVERGELSKALEVARKRIGWSTTWEYKVSNELSPFILTSSGGTLAKVGATIDVVAGSYILGQGVSQIYKGNVLEGTVRVIEGALVVAPAVPVVNKVEQSLKHTTTQIDKLQVYPKPNVNVASQKKMSEICPTTACFVAGTLVQTKKGLRPIEQIRLGELVWSRDEFGEMYDYKPVIAHKATPNQSLYEVVIENTQREVEKHYTTAEHPFYVEGEGWVKAALLKEGMVLLDRDGQEGLRIVSQKALEEKATVYNIEVESFRTYHIGQWGIWVHNANCCDFNQRYGNLDEKWYGRWVNEKGQVMYRDPIDGQLKPFPDGSIPSVDHILSRDYIKNYIPDFHKLSKAEQNQLINHADNLQPMPLPLNISKGKKVEFINGGWTTINQNGQRIPVSPEYKMILEGQQRLIKKMIEDELKQKGIKK
ncbi:hypothetical protein F9B74_09815 [Pelistega sp. NLN82]|uniref:Hint domain-containing protein n=1 Tax=Pelistega ratti TaxID=2652177 RepID=A0A6L9Y7W1_9BURK|nr:hemagglutinin repeat-containing protein [Pelistega ratti]NEN76600.1 hypothetical protein [Pelistega ratti]